MNGPVKTLETEKNYRGRDGEAIDEDQEPEVQSPVPLELTEVTLRRLLIVYLELIPSNHASSTGAALSVSGAAHPELDLAEAVGGQPQGELVAAPLVLEAVDAAQGLGHRHVEDEVGEGEQADGDPAVAALQPRRLGLGQEDESEEDEEHLEELPEFLLLEIHGPLLLEGLLEVKLDDGVEGLECRFFWYHVVAALRVVRH